MRIRFTLLLLILGLFFPYPSAFGALAKAKVKAPAAKPPRVPAAVGGWTSSPTAPQIKSRVRAIGGIRHLNVSLIAVRQGEVGALTSIALGWGPRLLRLEGALFEVRANLGVALLKRILPSSLFLAPEFWLLGSIRLNEKLRFEAGPVVQYWITTDQGLNLGVTAQLAYELKLVTYFDRILLTYQPVFNKVALTHFVRIGLGFSF